MTYDQAAHERRVVHAVHQDEQLVERELPGAAPEAHRAALVDGVVVRAGELPNERRVR